MISFSPVVELEFIFECCDRYVSNNLFNLTIVFPQLIFKGIVLNNNRL